MNKLPVFRTFGNAVGFTLWNCVTIFRLSWLPFGLYFAAIFGLGMAAQQILENKVDTGSLDFPIVMIGLTRVSIFYGAALLLQALATVAGAVAIHRVILFDDRKQGALASFAFGRTEFIYLVMATLTMLFAFTIFAAVFAPVIYLMSHGDVVGYFQHFGEKKVGSSPFSESF